MGEQNYMLVVVAGQLINKAILLCAGLGSRLRPLTDSIPKCLTEVDGKPILEQQIEALSKNGIEQIIVVVGYLWKEIVGRFIYDSLALEACDFTQSFLVPGHPGIKFIWNDDYATTNSAYSLWLAREYLADGCLILEGDVVFEPAVLPPLLAQGGSAIAVRQAIVGDDGCIISIADGKVQKMRIHQEPLGKVKPNQYKSCGIELVDDMFGKALVHELDLDENLRTVYKDEVIGHLVNLHDTSIVDIADLKCQEIDTRSDLLKAESAFTRPKYVVVIMDGAADESIARFPINATPLMVAEKPCLDFLAHDGKTGLVQTMYPGLPLGSVVAMLGILGYNPTRYYPNGRASFEAIAQDIYLDEDEIAFRCNIIKMDDQHRLIDATPAEVPVNILSGFEPLIDGFQFYDWNNYRCILLVKDLHNEINHLTFYEPHENIGKALLEITPYATKVNRLGATLIRFINDSMEHFNHLKKHDVIADNYALLPWSPSSAPHLPSFHGRHGIDGAIVSAMDFFRGIGKVARLQADRIEGATGFSDTDLDAKLRHTKNALRYNDIVFVHINAPDEESHARNIEGKIKAIERIDAEILAPLKEHLDTHYPGNYRLAVLPDHYSYVSSGKHGDKPVPYVIYGAGIKGSGCSRFSEQAIQSEHVLKSYEFMDFLRGD